LLKLVTLQRMLSVERDQVIQTVEQLVLDQVVLHLAALGPRFDPAVADNSLTPEHKLYGCTLLSLSLFLTAIFQVDLG